MHKPLLRYILFVSLLLGLSGCAAYQLDRAQHDLRTSFASRDYDRTVDLLDKFERKGIYKQRDYVLLNLEKGMTRHFSGHYESSSDYLTNAEDRMEQLYTKSISRGIQSFLLTNDNTLEYDGEDYEDIYLNVFKSLNFVHLDKLDAALVEARRIAFKLSQLEIKYKGLAKALEQADTLKRTEWKSGKANVQNSALGHYLSAVLYAKSGKADDARIEYQKLLGAFRDQPRPYNFNQPDDETLRTILRPQTYNLLLTAFAGRAPVKRQHDVRTYLAPEDLYLKFSLPSLQLYRSRVHRVQAVINDTLTVALPLLEEMDRVAREIYRVKEPIIYARAFARSFVKAAGVNAASNALEKEHEGLGFLANIFGKIGQEVSEKADLRSWQTMPGKAYVNVVQLPPGTHKVVMEYRGRDGRLLYTGEKQIRINQNENLELFETLYWN